MKAERQQKEPQKTEPIQSKRERSKLRFIDNRPQMANQAKLVGSIQKNDMPNNNRAIVQRKLFLLDRPHGLLNKNFEDLKKIVTSLEDGNSNRRYSDRLTLKSYSDEQDQLFREVEIDVADLISIETTAPNGFLLLKEIIESDKNVFLGARYKDGTTELEPNPNNRRISIETAHELFSMSDVMEVQHSANEEDLHSFVNIPQDLPEDVRTSIVDDEGTVRKQTYNNDEIRPVVLAHELIHAERLLNRHKQKGEGRYKFQQRIACAKMEEIETVGLAKEEDGNGYYRFTENKIRKSLNMPLRLAYASNELDQENVGGVHEAPVERPRFVCINTSKKTKELPSPKKKSLFDDY